MTTTQPRLTRQQCWALAMRRGMITDGATTMDVRVWYRELLAEHGLAPEPAGRGGAVSDLLTTTELCEQAGCTYRQADYWSNSGWLTPARQAAGSGTQRGYDRAELAVARRMTQLVKVGMHPQTAAYAARNGYSTWLSPTVEVRIGQRVEARMLERRGGDGS